MAVKPEAIRNYPNNIKEAAKAWERAIDYALEAPCIGENSNNKQMFQLEIPSFVIEAPLPEKEVQALLREKYRAVRWRNVRFEKVDVMTTRVRLKTY